MSYRPCLIIGDLPVADMKLTEEQKALLKAMPRQLQQETALAYIRNGYVNQKQSYLEACKKLKRKPSNSPETSGSEIINNPKVMAFIESVKEKVSESTNIDAKWLLERLKSIDELDISDIMNDDLSAFKALSEWPKVWRTSISGLDIIAMTNGDDVEQIVKKIKWPDKVKNLEMIGRHVSVKAWDKEVMEAKITNNIMPVPVADSVESWESSAQKQQDAILKRSAE